MKKSRLLKINAEANDIDLGELIKAQDFRILSVELYLLEKVGVHLNGTINITNSLQSTLMDKQDRYFASPPYSPPCQCHHYQKHYRGQD